MSNLYHEKQILQHCLIHTLNNILQKNEFNVEKMNEICYLYDERRWFNSHKSWIGLGNYDVNVLMGALKLHHLKVIWFDKRMPISSLNLEDVNLKAIIFNISTWFGKHWFAVLKTSERCFYNLDSKLENPQVVGNIQEFIGNYLKMKNVEIMLVFPDEIIF